MLYTETDIKRIATMKLMDIVIKDQSLHLDNVSYGEDMKVFCSAVKGKNDSERIHIGMYQAFDFEKSWGDIDAWNTYDLMILERHNADKKYTSIMKLYHIGRNRKEYEEIYTDDIQMYRLAMENKSKKSKIKHELEKREKHKKYDGKYHKMTIRKGDKFYDKYMAIVNEADGRKLKDGVELTLSYDGRYYTNDIYIGYTFRNKHQSIKKNNYNNRYYTK